MLHGEDPANLQFPHLRKHFQECCTSGQLTHLMVECRQNNDVKQPKKRCEVNVTKLEVPQDLLRRRYQLQIETAPSEAIRNQGDRTGTQSR